MFRRTGRNVQGGQAHYGQTTYFMRLYSRTAILTHNRNARTKVRGQGELWRQTQVVFIDRHGRPEDGIDDGGELGLGSGPALGLG